MIKIITALNNPIINNELKNKKNIEILFKDIQYKEGILEVLEKQKEINFIIIDENLPGEIELEDLIKKIIKKNNKIKIIITIKNQNKNNLKINNQKIIKIFYEGKLNLNKIINNKNNFNTDNLNKSNSNKKSSNFKKNNLNKKLFNIKTNNKKLKNKNTKIITLLGESKSGKSITVVNLAYMLRFNNYKILIIELNEEMQSIYTILGCKKFHRKIKNKKIKNKYKYIRKNKFKIKYVSKNLIKNMIIKINNNIDLISYNKLININIINKIKNKYDYILIELYKTKNRKVNKNILNISDKKILLIVPNLLGIKNGINLIIKNNLRKNNNLNIIINKYDNYSVDEKIIENIFNKNKIIGKIKYNKKYDFYINKNYKKINSKFDNKEIKKIINNIKY